MSRRPSQESTKGQLTDEDIKKGWAKISVDDDPKLSKRDKCICKKSRARNIIYMDNKPLKLCNKCCKKMLKTLHQQVRDKIEQDGFDVERLDVINRGKTVTSERMREGVKFKADDYE